MTQERSHEIMTAAADFCGWVAFPAAEREFQPNSRLLELILEDQREAFFRGAMWADAHPAKEE